MASKLSKLPTAPTNTPFDNIKWFARKTDVLKCFTFVSGPPRRVAWSKADFTGSPLNARPISVPKKRSWLVQIVDGDVTAQDTALSPSYGEFPPKLPPITPSNGSPVAELAS